MKNSGLSIGSVILSRVTEASELIPVKAERHEGAHA